MGAAGISTNELIDENYDPVPPGAGEARPPPRAGRGSPAPGGTGCLLERMRGSRFTQSPIIRPIQGAPLRNKGQYSGGYLFHHEILTGQPSYLHIRHEQEA